MHGSAERHNQSEGFVASLSTDANGNRRILFFDLNNKRQAIRLGAVPLKQAEWFKDHFEALFCSRKSGLSLDGRTTDWLARLAPAFLDRLADLGLIEPRQERKEQEAARLGEFVRTRIMTRPDVKPATLEVWSQTVRNLIEFFGDDKPLRSITAGDADDFKAWLRSQELAAATVAKRLAFARTFLHVARKHSLIDVNPFAEVKIPTANVSARQRFVGRDALARMLAVANPTWQTIIVLCRLGGLRCPSEVLSLEFRHIDWERNRITVPSPKTERYEGKESREIPLSAELRPYLLDASERAEKGQTHIVGGNHLAKAQVPNGWRNCNLRTMFEKIVMRAGLEPWPRLFHNLRSSRETELLEQFPVQVVAKWLGHDPEVMMKHYTQTTDEHFERASRDAESDAVATQNATQRDAAQLRADSQGSAQGDEGEGVLAGSCESAQTCANEECGEGGIRTPGEV
jgi:integrase